MQYDYFQKKCILTFESTQGMRVYVRQNVQHYYLQEKKF